MMDTEALRRFRFDTRLKGRAGWTTEEEFEREAAQLPDVSEKIKPVERDAQPPSEASSGSSPSDASEA